MHARHTEACMYASACSVGASMHVCHTEACMCASACILGACMHVCHTITCMVYAGEASTSQHMQMRGILATNVAGSSVTIASADVV